VLPLGSDSIYPATQARYRRGDIKPMTGEVMKTGYWLKVGSDKVQVRRYVTWDR
jgi:hypothetical protein